jgi:hypothetical protein
MSSCIRKKRNYHEGFVSHNDRERMNNAIKYQQKHDCMCIYKYAKCFSLPKFLQFTFLMNASHRNLLHF